MLNNKPLYTEFEILPKELDLTPSEIFKLDNSKWNTWALKCREHLISLYQNKNCPFSGNSKSEEQIISEFKKLDSLDVYDEENKVWRRNDNTNNNNYEIVLSGYNRYSSGITNWFPEIIEVKRTVKNRIQNSLFDSLLDEQYFLKRFDDITRKDIHKKEKLPKTISKNLVNELRLKLGHPATNFRAEVAKWIWTEYLKPFINDDELIVWDPSGGWAGRLVGFLSASSNKIFQNKKMVYIVTDPNPIVEERYQMLYSFWKENINPNLNVELIYHKLGSELINDTKTFEKYKNKVSIVFTSPPYFNRERYTEHKAQSFNKFNNYEHWRDYFLEPTLENAHELLRDNGFLLWNIADVDGYTLEYDSCDILEALEMKSVETIKMVMGTKNVDKHLGVAIDNGNFKKYENIFVYKKVIETTTDSVNNVNYKDEKAS